MKNEPVLTWGTIAAVLNAVQVLVLSIPPWAHALILVASVIASTIAARAQTVPNQPQKIGQAARAYGILREVEEFRPPRVGV